MTEKYRHIPEILLLINAKYIINKLLMQKLTNIRKISKKHCLYDCIIIRFLII